MKRVIIYRLGSLGDTVVALPCLHKIRDSFPDAERILLTNRPVSPAAPRARDILGGSGLIHDSIEYDAGLRSPRALLLLLLQLRRLNADTLVYLAAPRGAAVVRRDLVFFRACGIRQVIGAPITDDLLNNRTDADGEEEYECERLARCLRTLGPLDLDDPAAWRLGLTSDEIAEAGAMLLPFDGQPFVAVNMGGKAQSNDWGHANWMALFAMLTRRFADLRWAFVGAPSDVARADEIANLHPTHMLNLCGKLSIRGTAAALSRARLFTGHDSGPVHLASACAVPCVGIFSNMNKPHKWHPYGARHRILHSVGPISTITVDRVYEAVAEALRRIPSTSARMVDLPRP